NTQKFPKELDQATSLRLAAGHNFRRAELIALCMKYFEKYYALFERTEDLSLLIDEYNRLLVNRNREVRVLEPGNEYTGLALGINSQGELLVRRENGRVDEIYAGEVSVRGVYGYV
ncbi:MAG: biotin--[acetyl-CoA-carboxylase] ligase, partial [Lachnospiraceae bacterium]|nr:biotin--[acetyl-CoA-carboxylase] ligase [Lachnospiraceae bacterium]